MTHDSRRYHRGRRPTFVRAYGMLGAVGSGLETAGSAIGSGLESAAGVAAKAALGKEGAAGVTSALSNVGQGLQSLFSGGGGTEAGRLAALGQAVPEGVDIVGPSPTFTGPGFLQSMYQGFVHGPTQYANPSAATSLGAGLGGLLSTLDQLNAGRPGSTLPGGIGPIVSGLTGQVQRPRYDPSGPPPMAPGPIMGMLGQLLKGF